MVLEVAGAPEVVEDIRDFRTEFARYLQGRRHLSRSTVLDYHRDLTRIERSIGVPREKWQARDLEEFLTSSTYAYSTKARCLVVARLFHEWGARRGYWPLDPDLLDIRMPRRHRLTKRPLTLLQARTLLAHVWRPRDVRLAYLGLFAGLRVGEVAAVSDGDWTIGVGGIEVLEVVGKFDRLRRIPVHPELSKMRERILFDQVNKKQLQRRLREMRLLIDREDLTPHMLRRTFGRALSEAGVERDVIASLLGHALSGVTAESYVEPRWEEMVDAVSRLDYGPGQLRLW